MTFVTLAFALTTLAAGPASAQSGSPPPMDREMAEKFVEAIDGGKLTIHEEEIVGDTLEIWVNMAGWISTRQLGENSEITVGVDGETEGYIAPLPHLQVLYLPIDGDQGEGDLEIWTWGASDLEPALFTQKVKYMFKEAGRFFIYVGAQEPRVVDPRLPRVERNLRNTRVYITQTN